MGQVENYEAMFVSVGALQPNALAARLAGDVGRIDAYIDAVSFGVDETVG